jgi:DNA processing protein
MENNLIKLALLNLPGWGTVSVRKLLAVNSMNSLQDPKKILGSIEELSLKNKRIKVPKISDIQAAFIVATEISDQCKKLGIQIISEDSVFYPRRLRNKNSLQPLIFYVLGNSRLLNHNKIIAVIGTRQPDKWVHQSIMRIGTRCAEQDIAVLSGLALGCDTAAHLGCLESGGKAIGVLGCGLDEIYPNKSKSLADSIIDSDGCLVSEYAPGSGVKKFQLVARDKLQAGMADSVIVGQTKIDGGSMHAAKFGIKNLSRPVAVLSGKQCLGDSFSGNHKLMEKGALSLENTQDLNGFFNKLPKYKKAFLFDLDQTLVDSSLLESMRSSRNWKEVLSNLDLVKPVAGVTEFLNSLKSQGIQCGLVTSSPKHYASAICRKLNWDFDVIVAYHDTKRHKPEPEPLLKAIELLNFDNEDVIYIGDDIKDKQASVAANIDFIPVQISEVKEGLEEYIQSKILTNLDNQPE